MKKVIIFSMLILTSTVAHAGKKGRSVASAVNLECKVLVKDQRGNQNSALSEEFRLNNTVPQFMRDLPENGRLRVEMPTQNVNDNTYSVFLNNSSDLVISAHGLSANGGDAQFPIVIEGNRYSVNVRCTR